MNEDKKKEATSHVKYCIAVAFLIALIVLDISLSYRDSQSSQRENEKLFARNEVQQDVHATEARDSLNATATEATSDEEKVRRIVEKVFAKAYRTAPEGGSGAPGLEEIPFEYDYLAPVYPDSVSFDIVGTRTSYVLQPGETLIKVSVRFYGIKDMWPYLLMHNREIIQDPNRVYSGMMLKIPELEEKSGLVSR